MSELKDYEAFVESRFMGAGDAAGVLLSDRLRDVPYDLRDIFIMSTGLPGETGEVCEHLKKWVRDGAIDTPAVLLEIGDVLFYLTAITRRLGLSLSDAINANVQKIERRVAAGTIHGKGSDR